MKRLSYQFKSTATCYGIILPGVILLLVFVYAPVVWAILGSFSQFEIGGAQKFVGLANYKEYLGSDPTCWPSVVTMLLLTLFAVFIRLSVPLTVAKLIHSLPRERTRYIYRIIFLVPIVVPGVAVQLIWGGMIYSEHGMLNEILRAINLEQWTHGWLSDPRTVLGAIVMMGFPFIGGFDVLIYYAGLSSIPDSVTEAANLDGCTGIRKFFLIDIPMVLSQIKLILMLTIIGGLQGFEALFVLTKGGPGFKTMVPGLWMYFNAFSFQRMGYACSIGVILFLMIFGLTLFNIKYFKSSEEIQGVS